MVKGQWTMVNGQWTFSIEHKTFDVERWQLNIFQLTLKNQYWKMEIFCMDNGHWTMNN